MFTERYSNKNWIFPSNFPAFCMFLKTKRNYGSQRAQNRQKMSPLIARWFPVSFTGSARKNISKNCQLNDWIESKVQYWYMNMADGWSNHTNSGICFGKTISHETGYDWCLVRHASLTFFPNLSKYDFSSTNICFLLSIYYIDERHDTKNEINDQQSTRLSTSSSSEFVESREL